MRDVTESVTLGQAIYEFLLTRPMRDVTKEGLIHLSNLGFLLTRPMRDVTELMSAGTGEQYISTHTSHAGRDRYILYF